MEPVTQNDPSVLCHAKECALPAAFSCARCQRPCCADHARHLALEWREDRADLPGHRGMLERAPSHRATYLFCLVCSRKPIISRLQPQTGQGS